MRAAFVGACALALACDGLAASPTPTPGPAARAGGTIDKAWSTVQAQVEDALLLTRIRVALLEHLGSDGLRVLVQVHDGVVELSGKVERRSSEELAGAVARSLTGVRLVHNKVTLSPDAQAAGTAAERVVDKVEREVADAVLEGKVKTALLEELGKVAFDIEVEATDGVVSLSGTVPDSFRRELAVKIAKKNTGVKELHDLLRVKPPDEGK